MKKKIIKISIIVFLFIIIIGALSMTYLLRSSLSKTKGEIKIEGISNEVEIMRDRLGIPHIYAEDERDMFFACGYVHAQDRLWQMELLRRLGTGTLSEIFGERTLKTDIQMRVLGLKKAAKKDLEKLSPKMRNLFEAYCSGVNFYLMKKKILPPEFLILRYRPEPWTTFDSLLIKQIQALDLSVNMNSELLGMELIKKLGKEKAKEIIHTYPIDGEIINPSFHFETQISAFQNKARGSNSWVVDGSITQTGKPFLANDPHLGINILPPVWYGIHLNSSEINVIGASFPGIPIVIIGHNNYIAWGMTNSYVDVQDLYLEKLDDEQMKYFFNGEWRNLEIHEEEITIKGKKKAEIIEIKWTHRGPIITPWIIKSEIPISLRWIIHDGGQAGESFYLINKARNWNEFVAGASLFDAPSQNLVYADGEGNIGYYLSGKIPLRENHKGLFPVPGETDEYDWMDYLKEDKKPFSFNPGGHFIVTANNKIVSDDYPDFLGDDYLAPFRAERIKELIIKTKKHTLDSFKEIQFDVFSRRSQLFLPFIKEVNNLSGDAKKAQDILANWDGKMSEGKEAALFEVFFRFFQENTFKDELGDSFTRFRDVTARKWGGLLKIMDNAQSSWFDNTETPEMETREDMINQSLTQAYRWLSEKFGSPEKWDWSKMHALHFEHALGQVPIFKFFNRGPFPIRGSEDTVNASFFKVDDPFRTIWGVSYRQIIDLTDMKKSVFVIPSGQSGHFLSRHYDDQINLWLEGRYYPMLFSREDLAENTKGKLILKPIIKND